MKNTLIIGLAAILGITVVGIGEWLLLFAPSGGYGFEDYSFLAGKNLQMANIGHFMSVLFAPAYFLGYYFIFRNLKTNRPWVAKCFFGLAIYTFFLAMVWISSRSILVFSVAEKAISPDSVTVIEKIIRAISHDYDILLKIVWGLIIGLSGLFSYLVGTGQSYFSRKYAFFPPVVILASIFILYAVFPRMGNYILPTAMNVTHVIFLILGILFLKRT